MAIEPGKKKPSDDINEILMENEARKKRGEAPLPVRSATPPPVPFKPDRLRTPEAKRERANRLNSALIEKELVKTPPPLPVKPDHLKPKNMGGQIKQEAKTENKAEEIKPATLKNFATFWKEKIQSAANAINSKIQEISERRPKR